MLYLNEIDMQHIGVPWRETIGVIGGAVQCLAKGDFAQPIKPYLRYRDLKNRIIAMPAFIGGEFNMAGLKWIASFPANIDKGLPRAHSTIVLNEADTGVPLAVINTALLSIVRTASVSGFMIRHFDAVRPLRDAVVGMTGWGPIGQYHARMILDQWGDRIAKLLVYDIRGVDLTMDMPHKEKIQAVGSWQEAYTSADVFMTCTVSKESYIHMPPKAGSLQLNVSLRDYCVDILDHVRQAVIVDDWDEVCRENTDIENMHRQKGLQREETRSIIDVAAGCMKQYAAETPVMFNPMGMAVFDIAMAVYYLQAARQKRIGVVLQ